MRCFQQRSPVPNCHPRRALGAMWFWFGELCSGWRLCARSAAGPERRVPLQGMLLPVAPCCHPCCGAQGKGGTSLPSCNKELVLFYSSKIKLLRNQWRNLLEQKKWVKWNAKHENKRLDISMYLVENQAQDSCRYLERKYPSEPWFGCAIFVGIKCLCFLQPELQNRTAATRRDSLLCLSPFPCMWWPAKNKYIQFNVSVIQEKLVGTRR